MADYVNEGFSNKYHIFIQHQSLADQITQHHTHVLHIRDFLDEGDISHKTGYQPTRECKVYLTKIIQS